MRDQIIRHAFHQTVLKSAHDDGNTFVVDELGLKNGKVRADIAVLNGKLIGYEIKTARDNLARLPAQVEAYNDVFDKAYLIVSKNHLAKALLDIPHWWGIYLIDFADGDNYSFLPFRKAMINKKQDCYSLAQFLWKIEAIEVANIILRNNVNPKTTKKEIYELISGTCSKSKLTKIIINYLKRRDNWKTDRLSLLKSDG